MKLWKKAVAVMLTAVMSLTLLTACSGGGGGTPSPAEQSAVKETIKNVNTVRGEYSVGALVEDAQATEIAQQISRSYAQYCNGEISNEVDNAQRKTLLAQKVDGKAYSGYVRRSGTSEVIPVESLRKFAEAENVTRSDRKIVRDANATKIGVGISATKDGKYIITIMTY